MSTYSLAEIAKHNNKENGVWIIVEGRVYDINNYLVDHPGGEDILIDGAGTIFILFSGFGNCLDERIYSSLFIYNYWC